MAASVLVQFCSNFCQLNYFPYTPVYSLLENLFRSITITCKEKKKCFLTSPIAASSLKKPAVLNEPPKVCNANNCDETNVASSSKSHKNSKEYKPAMIEVQYTDYFQRIRTPYKSIRNTFWRALRVLDLYDKEALQLMCQDAYTIWKKSNLQPNIQVKHGRTRFPFLFLAQRRSYFSIDVLPCIAENCETYQKEKFYITKGRRLNSVYFVKPMVAHNNRGLPDDFALDQRFQTDFDLPHKFGDVAVSLIREIFKEENPII